MILDGCQSQSKQITIEERKCPRCGHEVELFSVDTEVQCENCGFTIYNEKLSCAQWCKYAQRCFGDRMYEQMLKLAENRKKASQ